MHGLNLYDYSARYYESAIGRFTTVDPLAEKYYSISPYAYVANNPLRFTDPTGMEPNDGIWDELKKILKQTVNEILTATGLSEGQIQSDNPAVLEDASQKRIAAAENIDAVNEILLTPVPGGTVINKVATGRGNDVTLGEGAMAVAEIAPVGKILKVGKAVSEVAVIGRKLDYVFGKATGRLHNLERSSTMQRQLNSIGIFDNKTGRSYLKGELGKALNSSNNILKRDGDYITRESLLMGPNGGLLMESRWQGNKLNTIILKGK